MMAKTDVDEEKHDDAGGKKSLDLKLQSHDDATPGRDKARGDAQRGDFGPSSTSTSEESPPVPLAGDIRPREAEPGRGGSADADAIAAQAPLPGDICFQDAEAGCRSNVDAIAASVDGNVDDAAENLNLTEGMEASSNIDLPTTGVYARHLPRPGAFHVHPSYLINPRPPPRGPRDGGLAAAVEAELRRMSNIPVAEAEAVGAPPPAMHAVVSPSPLPGDGGGGRGDVIQAESVPTVTICGRTLERSTVKIAGATAAVAILAVVALTVWPLAVKSTVGAGGAEDADPRLAELRSKQAWEQRRRNLVDILYPLARDGAFDPGGRNVSADRVDALDWLAGDFPDQLSTVAEMTDHYPEWKMRQRYALALLYFSTNGPGWFERLFFVSSKDECRWHGRVPLYQGNKNILYNEFGGTGVPAMSSLGSKGGVKCNGNGRVVLIDLGRNNLVGTIPDEVSTLGGNLRALDLTLNTISSSIPASLGELENLQELNLYENCLTGEIPESLSELRYLTAARFEGNNDLKGNLNTFCDGTGYRESMHGKLAIYAECGHCPGSTALVECTCCNCCDSNTMSCCDKAGNITRSDIYAWETFNRGECSLNDRQQKWKEEHCPCFIRKKAAHPKRGNHTFMRAICSTDCPP